MKISYRKRITVSFIIAVLVMLSVGASVYNSFRVMNTEKDRVDHTYTVISTLEEVLSNIKDVQSSQRGYVITGMEEYLVPYHLAIPKIGDDLVALTHLIADNPAQVKRSDELNEHVKNRIDVAEKIIAVTKQQGQKAAINMVKQGSGKHEMDQIRAIVAEMISEEQKLLASRRTSVENYTLVTLYAGLSGLLICIGILTAVFALIHKESAQRIKTEDSLREAMERMERHNAEALLVGRLGDYLRGSREQHEAYEMIASTMPALFPHSFGSVSLFNNSRDMLQPVLRWGDLPKEADHEFEAEDCWALRQGKGHLVVGNDETVPVCPHLENVGEENVSYCLPMQAQGETIGQIYFGAERDKVRHVSTHEMGMMRRVTEQISLAIANLNLQRALKEQSIKDPLTKLYNRRYLEETLNRECSRALRGEQPLCVLIMDIDHFKKVNDTYGHDGGDAVLVAFAKLLSTKIRKEDIACRLGGEEFILVLPAATLELATHRAQEICDAARSMKVKFQSQTLAVTVSVGVAAFPEHADAPDELIQKADQCLYKAKQSGRNQVVVYDPKMAKA